MSKKSTQIAIGGVFSGLCLMLMFLTGMVPLSIYTLPALAGAMLVAVVEENGRGTAWLVYISVSVLSVFIVPDREAAIMFIVFFGYYPILQPLLARIRPWLLRMLVKLAMFNLTVAGGYWVGAHVLGMAELLEGLDDYGRYGVLLLLGVGSAVFMMYDFVLTRYTYVYIHWFKPRFLRR